MFVAAENQQNLPKPKMLYEPPNNLKKIILIGSAALFLAVLVIVATPLLYKSKKTPTANLPATSEQQKIQKEFEKLEAIRKSTNARQPTQEEIQKEFAELEKQKKESNTTPPTQEQIQKEFEKLEQMRK
jgi:hypothetical protein